LRFSCSNSLRSDAVAADALDLIQTTLLGEAADHAPIAIFVADEDMRYLAVNRRACDLLGYTRMELLEMHVSDVSPMPLASQLFDRLVRRGSQSGTVALRRRDGSELVASYEARETTMAGMRVFVSFVQPAPIDGRAPS
jgi:PAS domain S-box-containing protein